MPSAPAEPRVSSDDAPPIRIATGYSSGSCVWPGNMRSTVRPVHPSVRTSLWFDADAQMSVERKCERLWFG